MIYIKIQAYSVKSYTSFFYAKIRRLEKYVFQKRASQTGISGRNEKDESQGSGNVERGIFAVGKALLMAASKASVCLWGNKKDMGKDNERRLISVVLSCRYDGCDLTDNLIKTNQNQGLIEQQVKAACDVLLQ